MDITGRKHQAEKLVKERLEASDTPSSTKPRLLCQLGDITGVKQWWQQAWEEVGAEACCSHRGSTVSRSTVTLELCGLWDDGHFSMGNDRRL